jgi:hypothetical protein
LTKHRVSKTIRFRLISEKVLKERPPQRWKRARLRYLLPSSKKSIQDGITNQDS